MPQQQECIGISAADNADTSLHGRSKATPKERQSVMCNAHPPDHLPMQAGQPYKTQAAVPNEQAAHLRAQRGAESELLRLTAALSAMIAQG